MAVPALEQRLADPRLFRLRLAPAAPAEWRLSRLAGHLVELSGRAATADLTLAFALVLEAQRQGEPAVWLTTRESSFYPPDAGAAGVDLEALVVVRLAAAHDLPRAAEHLARSGAFGLLVLDLGRRARILPPMQKRLHGLAKKHDAAVLCLTEKASEASSLGSLVSLRAEAVRRPVLLAEKAAEVGRSFACTAHVLKDKRRGPGWSHTEICHGPDGLC